VSSLEFPIVILLVTYTRETMINEWDTCWIESSEGANSLCWAGREEESWWKLG